MKNKQEGFAIPIIIAIVALLVIGGGAYVYTNNKTEVPVKTPDIVSNVPTTTPGNIVGAKNEMLGWKTYKVGKYNFEIKYPDTAVVEIGNDETNGDWYKIKAIATDSVEADVMVSFPQEERCGAYGPGVASQRVSEEITLNNKKYNVSGWIEDAENYVKWSKDNPQFSAGDIILPGNPAYKRYYEKKMVVCEKTFQLNYGVSFKNLVNQDDLAKANTLVGQIVSTIKIN